MIFNMCKYVLEGINNQRFINQWSCLKMLLKYKAPSTKRPVVLLPLHKNYSGQKSKRQAVAPASLSPAPSHCSKLLVACIMKACLGNQIYLSDFGIIQ
jgi:hypothetical protein